MKTCKRQLLLTILFMTLLSIIPIPGAAISPDSPIVIQERTYREPDGSFVKVSFAWLERYGEFSLTITYWGYLIQEGPVNVWLCLNGISRECVTLNHELPNRARTITIYSFHPPQLSPNFLSQRPLNPWELVDRDLFKNAAYYGAFGECRLEMKFFVHGRWHGEKSNENQNLIFLFQSPLS